MYTYFDNNAIYYSQKSPKYFFMQMHVFILLKSFYKYLTAYKHSEYNTRNS